MIAYHFTAHDESEALRRRSQEWFNRYVQTGFISPEEILSIPDPADKPEPPFSRDP